LALGGMYTDATSNSVFWLTMIFLATISIFGLLKLTVICWLFKLLHTAIKTPPCLSFLYTYVKTWNHANNFF
jgi:hypothetical protein